MPTTSVRDIELILPGSFGKETLSNDGMQNLALGISGAVTIALTNVDRPLTATEGLAFVLILTGTVTADVAVIVPQESRVYIVDNRCTVPGAHSVTVRPPVGGGITVDSGGQRAVLYCDGTDVYPVASGTGGSGGGSGAPTEASYLVQSAHSLLTGERVVTDSPTVLWDFATPGAARALIPPDAVSYTHLQNVTPTRLLGRFTGVAGDVQEITPGTGLTLDAGTGVLSATAVGQPLDATLTALAGLTTGANLLPYFTGVDTVTTTTLSAFVRTLLDDGDAATARGTLGAQASDATLTALAGVTTSADTLAFFTGVDTASTTTLTAFMRSLLDDPDATTARSTLGVAGGGGGSTDFLGLTDTPDSYAGQSGKGLVVNGTATGLEFTTAATGSYDLGLTWSGTLPASQVLMRYPFPRAVDFPAGLTGSQGRAAVAATGATTLDLRKNGTSVGSVQYAASATTATFIMASATSFAAGDVLTVHAPGTADATLADLGLSLAGTRAVVAGEMGATTFLGLTDTPDVYASNALKILRVNAAATATEFGPVLGTLATQNANAVAITDGRISVGGHAPTGVLDVQGSVQASDFANVYFGPRVWPVAPSGAAAVFAVQVEPATGAGMATSVLHGCNVANQPATFTQVKGVNLDISAGTNRWNIFAGGSAANHFAGNVGIGTAPSYPLDVTGEARVSVLTATDTITANNALGIGVAANPTYALATVGAKPNYFGGNVGILTGTPSYPLDVTGNVRVTGNVGIQTAPAGDAQLHIAQRRDLNHHAIQITAIGNDGNGLAALFRNTASAQVGSIYCTSTTTAYNTSSDRRLKRSIQELTGVMAAVKRLRPVSFRWNSDDSSGEGFVADELMTVVPHAVSGLPDEINPDGSIKPQQVDHSKLIPLLTAALKEAIARIDALEARVLALEGA